MPKYRRYVQINFRQGVRNVSKYTPPLVIHECHCQSETSIHCPLSLNFDDV